MTNLKFPLIAIVVSLTLSFVAKGEDDEAAAGPQNVAPDNGKGEVVPGQTEVKGPLKPVLQPVVNWAQGVKNTSVKPINDSMRDPEGPKSDNVQGVPRAQRLQNDIQASQTTKTNLDT